MHEKLSATGIYWLLLTIGHGWSSYLFWKILGGHPRHALFVVALVVTVILSAGVVTQVLTSSVNLRASAIALGSLSVFLVFVTFFPGSLFSEFAPYLIHPASALTTALVAVSAFGLAFSTENHRDRRRDYDA